MIASYFIGEYGLGGTPFPKIKNHYGLIGLVSLWPSQSSGLGRPFSGPLVGHDFLGREVGVIVSGQHSMD